MQGQGCKRQPSLQGRNGTRTHGGGEVLVHARGHIAQREQAVQLLRGAAVDGLPLQVVAQVRHPGCQVVHGRLPLRMRQRHGLLTACVQEATRRAGEGS